MSPSRVWRDTRTCAQTAARKQAEEVVRKKAREREAQELAAKQEFEDEQAVRRLKQKKARRHAPLASHECALLSMPRARLAHAKAARRKILNMCPAFLSQARFSNTVPAVLRAKAESWYDCEETSWGKESWTNPPAFT